MRKVVLFSTRERLTIILLAIILLTIKFPLHPHGLDPDKRVYSYLSSSWDMDNGLPQNSVLAIAQGSNKYLWLGTENALTRFDGVNFTVFNSKKYKAIKSNRIQAILADSEGNLWFGGRGGGLNRLQNGNIDHFSAKDGLTDNFVLSIFEDSRKNIWVGTFKGISIFSIDGNIKKFDHKDIFNKITIMSIIEDNSGNIWIGSYNNGIFRIRNDSVQIFNTEKGLPDNSVRKIVIDNTGTLWAGTNKGLAHFSKERFVTFTKNSELSSLLVYSLYLDSNENLWIGTAKGLHRFANGKIESWPHSNKLSKSVIRSIAEDHEGSLWIGTNGKGLFRIQNGKFGSIKSNDGLSSENITTIFEDSYGRIWIGTDGKGLNYLENSISRKVRYITKKNGLSSDFIYSVAEDMDGRIWIGTMEGITILNKESLEVKKIINTKYGLAHNSVGIIYRGKKDYMWIGTSGGGINRFGGDKILNYSTENGLSNNFVYSIYEDRNGIIWIGTYGGGVDMLKDGTFTNISTKNGLSNDFIFSIQEDKNENIWLATGGGLNKISNGKVTKFLNQNDIFSNTIYNILLDDLDQLWLTSNIGIYRIKCEDLISGGIKESPDIPVYFYNKKDGLNSNECSGGIQPAGWKTKSGELWIPTIRGIATIIPKKEHLNKKAPPVFIEKIVSGSGEIIDLNSSVLKAGTKDLEFYFTALSYLVPGKVKFKIKLEGLDKKWIELKNTKRRRISYSGLNPGYYTFRVIASNNDGIWNLKGASFDFLIKTFFYQTKWFLFIIALLTGLIILYIYKIRAVSIKRKESELRQLVDMRTEDLVQANLRLSEANEQKSELLSMAAHDLKNPLQAIMGFSELISLKKESSESIKKSSRLILETSKGMLDTINNTLNSAVIKEGEVKFSRGETIDVCQLSRLVVGIYTEFAKKKNQIIVTRYWNDCYIEGDKERIKIVLENLLSNAIKYSPLNKNIVLTVEKRDENIIVSVKDEGPGFSEEDKKKLFTKFQRLSSKPTGGESSTGIGLSITKKIVEMHKGKIWLESKDRNGTTFFVSFSGVHLVDTWKMK
ncbi:MAG: two-component regulator propeller domain-containing protein [Acidobacteriota bacterium]